MKKSFLTVLALLSVWIIPHLAHASGIQVSPSKLHLDFADSTPRPVELVVVNPASNTQTFEVYADELTDLIAISPTEFKLETGQRQSVRISVKNSLLPPAAGPIMISVVAKPLTADALQANSGVKIPLTITTPQASTTPANNLYFWLLSSLALVAAALSIATVYYLDKRKKLLVGSNNEL